MIKCFLCGKVGFHTHKATAKSNAGEWNECKRCGLMRGTVEAYPEAEVPICKDGHDFPDANVPKGEGVCTCSSFFTIRGKHKPDCDFAYPPKPEPHCKTGCAKCRYNLACGISMICPCHKPEPPELFKGESYRRGYMQGRAEAISSFKKEIVEKIGEKKIEIQLAQNDERVIGWNSALSAVIKLLNEPQ